MMNEQRKSDSNKVPAKPLNKAGYPKAAAEGMEGKTLTKGKTSQQNTLRTQQAGNDVQSALDRIRKLAKQEKGTKFNNLMHHIYNVDRLRKCFFEMKKKAAAGIDEVTWHDYEENLERNLQDLSRRLKVGGYKAKPVRRVFIDKADGKKRPLGVPVLEDKLVQRSTVEVMNAIYETDFRPFSYGYRPGRSQHNCLDALYVGLLTRKVNWVMDADIKGFFDSLNHEWLVKFVEHRIGDDRVIRLIRKWLKAGVMNEGTHEETSEGVPQGGSISPLLANIYLHYALDLWVDHKRRDKSRGEVIIVRWADDFVMGFEHKSQAENYLAELKDRMRKFSLELHPEKTRILEFGPWARYNRKRRQQGKPETFGFLGFTHIVGVKFSNGMYTVLRQTIRKKMRIKLTEVKQELRQRMSHPVNDQGKWLKSIVEGHCRYYGVPGNPAPNRFRFAISQMWWKTLRRRGNRRKLQWRKMEKIVDRWLPQVKLHHPYPLRRMGVIT
ncbi:MAG: group II intron reverse transcriptase/maturase [Bdellovibrionaceae bacterium]|nr:group II intron reverse transcriptase/maturase [Pseudobdellovibrionaceae bacterium]